MPLGTVVADTLVPSRLLDPVPPAPWSGSGPDCGVSLTPQIDGKRTDRSPLPRWRKASPPDQTEDLCFPGNTGGGFNMHTGSKAALCQPALSGSVPPRAGRKHRLFTGTTGPKAKQQKARARGWRVRLSWAAKRKPLLLGHPGAGCSGGKSLAEKSRRQLLGCSEGKPRHKRLASVDRGLYDKPRKGTRPCTRNQTGPFLPAPSVLSRASAPSPMQWGQEWPAAGSPAHRRTRHKRQMWASCGQLED